MNLRTWFIVKRLQTHLMIENIKRGENKKNSELVFFHCRFGFASLLKPSFFIVLSWIKQTRCFIGSGFLTMVVTKFHQVRLASWTAPPHPHVTCSLLWPSKGVVAPIFWGWDQTFGSQNRNNWF